MARDGFKKRYDVANFKQYLVFCTNIGKRPLCFVFLFYMKYSSIPVAQTVIQHCKSKGIQNIIISPGSRNAPLTIGFTEDVFFKCFSIVDERSAAFFALGIAQQLRVPVAVVCTSGSALLNYYPAVSEAFYSNIPLVVISADRPAYKIDVGDGQTIRQDNVFHRHIGYSANLKQDLIHAYEKVLRYAPEYLKYDAISVQQKIQAYNDKQLNKAFKIAITKGLPIHINVRFEEPLYETLSEPTVSANCRPIIASKNNTSTTLKAPSQLWNTSCRKMVLVGVNDPNTINLAFLTSLATDPSVLVLTETTSNIQHTNFFPSIDSLLAPIEKSDEKDYLFSKLQPELLLTFGGLIVSKKIKAFLRQYQPKHHWHIDPVKANNTFFSLSHHFKMSVNNFYKEIYTDFKPIASEYFSYWNKVKLNYESKRKAYLNKIPFSDMLAFHIINEQIPEKYQLQLANSSTVRYAQLFNIKPSLSVFCNRGTSGIDGSTSTAVGASIYSTSPTVLITGDLSFLYDSNGLWNNYLRSDFRIIVINNSGGGIFRILPGKEESKNFEYFFETKHTLKVKKICEMYSINYMYSETEKSLKSAMYSFFAPSAHPKLLEVSTERLLNDKILLGYFDFIS